MYSREIIRIDKTGLVEQEYDVGGNVITRFIGVTLVIGKNSRESSNNSCTIP